MRAQHFTVLSLSVLLISAVLVETPAVAGGAGSFLDSAINFRDAATSVYQQGVDVCGGDCEPELAYPLSNLGASLGPLSAAIASANPQPIRDAITNTAATLQPICNALRVDCPTTPVGAMKDFENAPLDLAGPYSCESICGRLQSACIRSGFLARDSCVNRINEYVGCRLQTPFCDWQSAPFDSAAYATCRSTAFYRQFLQDCRCPVPPGQAQREGGCPLFFTQGLGQVGTGVCEVPDGLGCARCCNAKCVGADPRLSCQGGNREECDVCEWSRRTLLAGNSMRTSICEESLFRRLDMCDARFDACLQECALRGL